MSRKQCETTGHTYSHGPAIDVCIGCGDERPAADPMSTGTEVFCFLTKPIGKNAGYRRQIEGVARGHVERIEGSRIVIAITMPIARAGEVVDEFACDVYPNTPGGRRRFRDRAKLTFAPHDSFTARSS